MPEIVFSSSINMNDVINLASLYKVKIKQHKIAEEVSKNIRYKGFIRGIYPL